jgi:hypothetical protein
MNKTFGEPSLARRGIGQAGLDWSTVRPMIPENALPGLYSFKGIKLTFSLFFRTSSHVETFALLNRFVIVI